jgi:hypothetical protein
MVLLLIFGGEKTLPNGRAFVTRHYLNWLYFSFKSIEKAKSKMVQ